MSCSTFNLIDDDSGCYAIRQGATFDSLVILWPDDDLTDWTPRGQIRTNYVDASGVVLAEFTFADLTFGPETIDGTTANYTRILPSLSASETQAISAPPKALTEDFIPGSNCWVYDIEIESPDGVVKRLVEGVVTVSREVTR